MHSTDRSGIIYQYYYILLCTGFYIIVLWTVDYFIENDDDNESPTY